MSQFNAPSRKGFQKAVHNPEGSDMQDAELEHLFIVSVDEILVARDIEMSIAELFPKARRLAKNRSMPFFMVALGNLCFL